MQNRRYVAALCFTTLAGLFVAAACGDSDDDGASTGAGVETPDATADTGPKVTPLDSGGGTFVDPEGGANGNDSGGNTTHPGDGGTCLDHDAIDQTKYRYIKAASILKGSCTSDELDTLAGYYVANAPLETFSVLQWEKTVSSKCAACVFVDDGLRNDTVWRPIVVVGDAIDTIDVGGCVEHVTGSTECGKAFQQYEDCQTEACATGCTTQGDYAACRADPAIFTGPCKAATDAVNAACGEANVNIYEAQCNYGLIFEGPIHVGCIGDVDAGIPDAGPDGGDAGADAGDAGDSGT